MDIFKWRKISLASLYAGLLFALIGLILQYLPIPFYICLTISVLCLLAFGVITFLYWKCPHCGRKFDIRHGKVDGMKTCPHCGESLLPDDEDSQSKYLM